MKPLKLQSPRVWRTYTGGKLLDRWHKKEPQMDTQFPEEWIASTIAARNPGRENLCEGLSIAEGVPLKERIASSPERYLGAAHYKRYGVSTGILIKMLDAAERLTIQVHPDQAAARALFFSLRQNGKLVRGGHPRPLRLHLPGISSRHHPRPLAKSVSKTGD